MAWHRTWNEAPGDALGRGFAGWRRRPSAVSLVVLVTVGVYVADWMSGFRLIGPLGALSVDRVMRLELWRLVTYQFLHGGFWHIAINMFILWMLGRHIEGRLGRKKFLALYFLSGAVGGLFQIGFNILMTHWRGPAALFQPTVGASGSVMGVLMAFAVLYPREELLIFIFFFPLRVEARWFAVGYFILESVYAWQALALGLDDRMAHAAHLGGLVVGFVWMKFGARIASRLGRLAGRGRAREEVRPGRRSSDDEAEVDRILKKIHEEGIDRLTPREKMFLQDASRRRGR